MNEFSLIFKFVQKLLKQSSRKTFNLNYQSLNIFDINNNNNNNKIKKQGVKFAGIYANFVELTFELII